MVSPFKSIQQLFTLSLFAFRFSVQLSVAFKRTSGFSLQLTTGPGGDYIPRYQISEIISTISRVINFLGRSFSLKSLVPTELSLVIR